MPSNIAFIEDLLKRAQQQQPGAQTLPVIPPRTSPTVPFAGAPVPPITVPAEAPAPQPIAMDQIGQVDPSTLPEIGAMPAAAQQAQMPEITPEEAYAELGDPNRYKKGGKGRNEKWSTWEKIASALAGWATGGLAGGVSAATDRNFFNKISDARQAERLLPVIGQRQKEDQLYRQNRMTDAQIRNLDADNVYQNERLGEFKADRLRKEGDRASREATARMNAVAGMFKNLPSYDPTDPKFKDLTAALGDVNLPITPKDAKKNVRLEQDKRTGEWTTVLTDPVSGKQETRTVMKDGKPFRSTPTVVMQGEYGMFKQNDQQAFTAAENEKDRQARFTLENQKIAARQGFDQYKTIHGEQKARQYYTNDFIQKFRKENGVNPTPDQIADFLALFGDQE